MIITNRSTHVDIWFANGEIEDNIQMHAAFEIIDWESEEIIFVCANDVTDGIWINFFVDNELKFEININGNGEVQANESVFSRS